MPACYDDLAAVRIFAGLSPHQLERISQRLQECVFLSGMVILSRNAPPEKLYLILEGRVRVELQDGNGQIFNVTELGRGEIIGERAILTGEARTADVRAISEVRAVSLGRNDFEELLHETPQIYANLCRILAYQLGSWASVIKGERSTAMPLTNVIAGNAAEFGPFPIRPMCEPLTRGLHSWDVNATMC